MAQWPDGVWPGSTSFSNFWYNLASRTPDPSEVWASPIHIFSSIFIYFLPLQKSRTSGWRFVLNISQPKTLSLFAQIEASCSITNGVAVPRFPVESQLLCMGPWFALRIPYAFLLLHFWTVSAECLWLDIHFIHGNILATLQLKTVWKACNITYLRILRTTQEFLLSFPQHGKVSRLSPRPPAFSLDAT